MRNLETAKRKGEQFMKKVYKISSIDRLKKQIEMHEQAIANGNAFELLFDEADIKAVLKDYDSVMAVLQEIGWVE